MWKSSILGGVLLIIGVGICIKLVLGTAKKKNLTQRMTSMAAFWFYQELAHQCLLVKMAVEYLISCRTRPSDGLNREYYHLQCLLVALGNISKILWPPMKRGNKELCELQKDRGSELIKTLNIKNGSILKRRMLRNTFEHLDERMDKWHSVTKRNGFSDWNVGSMESAFIPRPEEQIRTFIPDKWIVVYCGEEFQLAPFIKEVVFLFDAVQKRIGQPGHEIKLLSAEIENEIDNAILGGNINKRGEHSA